MSLYGMNRENDCRKAIDELLELHYEAEQKMHKEAISALKVRLQQYYEKQNSTDEAQMSDVERAYFWPAIQQCFVKAPNPDSRNTWQRGLCDVRLCLTNYRPK
jgi:hypothetical protein